MKKYLIDTNFLLRFLLNDIPSQVKIVEEYLLMASKKEIEIFIPLLVIIEIDFALSKSYKFSKIDVIEKITRVISFTFLDVENRFLITKALQLYAEKNISLVDACFYMQSIVEGKVLLTFDKKLKNLKIPNALLQK